MLDFYASWCAACKELDHKTYADPAVAAKLDDYVNVKLDFTRSSETTQALTEKYQIPGLPVVIFMDAEWYGSQTIHRICWSGGDAWYS